MMLKSRTNVRVATAAVVIGLIAGGTALPARASMTVLLEQPYGKLGIFAPAGHSAIYLDRVCAATPLRLRPCRAGELGSVISRYDGIGDHDWLAMPLIPYLYAVETEAEIPTTMDKATEESMRDAYRRKHLESVAADREDGSAPVGKVDGNWYELVGSAFDRTSYGFRVATTAEQDEMFIAIFNDQKNTERYNGIYRNCADFVRVTVNRAYPHAIRRNYIADLGMTSPKSVARGLSHYARKHPEADLDVFVIPQVPGSLGRSRGSTDFMEGVVKRYSLPLVLLSPQVEGVALVAYVAHGRFAMPKNAPELDLDELKVQLSLARPFPVEMPKLPEVRQPLVTQGATPAGTVVPPVALQQ